MSVVNEPDVKYHIRSNLKETAGVIGTPDVFVIFWRAAIAIEYHDNLMIATATKLSVSEVSVGNSLPGLTCTMWRSHPTSTTILEQGWSQDQADW